MKKLILFLLLLVSLNVRADDVTFDLQNVRLFDLARVIYSDLLNRSFVFDSSFLQNNDSVSMTLKNKSSEQLESEFSALLKDHGFNLDTSGKVIHIKAVSLDHEGEKVFYFHPKYRSVNYLLGLVKFAFPKGQFLNGMQTSGVSFAQVQGTMGLGAGGGMPQMGMQQGGMQQAPSMPMSSPSSGVNANASTDVDVIAFRGSKSDIATLSGILAELDVPIGEVVINAAVYEYQNNDTEASAVDLALHLIGGVLGTSQSTGAAGSVSSIFVKNGAINAVWSALNTDSHFKVMTSPRVRVRSGANAKFTVGDSVPVLGQISMSSTGQPIQSVNYMNSGVIFTVSPIVRGDSIDINVDQQISSFVQTSNGVNNSPTLTMRELSSDVQLKDGELVLIGGLDQDNAQDASSRLPFLPSWLGSKSSSKGHSQIVLLLHVQKI
jgi:general secretion pathway protein D